MTADFCSNLGKFERHLSRVIDGFLQGAKEDEEEAEDKERPLPLLPTLKALLAAWGTASHATATQRGQDVAEALKEALQPGTFACSAHGNSAPYSPFAVLKALLPPIWSS